MAIRTFSAQKSYREGGTESRKKLKKVRSVKVANLDRLRLSMRREKSRFHRSVVSSSDDATGTSGSSSVAISGTSSPNYMKATTSWSARKGSVQTSSGNLQSSSASNGDSRPSSAKSASKLSKVSVQECSDPAGVNIPVRIKAEKSLKRVPSLKHSKKLSSKKSMKIRTRYSQFPDVGINPEEMLDFGILGFQDNTEIDPESLNVSASHGQDSSGKVGAKQKGILERSRSRKMTRLRSIRSSKGKQRPQPRLSGGATELMSYEAEVSNAEPRYMKSTRSQETRMKSDKCLTRTSSLRPLRILAKIPSLRPKRSKLRKRPQATPLSRKGVDRATCSSVLKRTEFPDDSELHSRGQEAEGTSSFHLCPYSYCSIHGHRHHTPSQPIKEFISAKRRLFSNKKGEKSESQYRGEVEHYTSAAESDHSRQTVSAESYALQEVMNVSTKNALEAEEDGIDFLIKIYAKPRKQWATDGKLSKDDEALHGSTYDQISVRDYDGKHAETPSETSEPEETQEALNDNKQEKNEIFRVCNNCPSNKFQQQNLNIAAISLPSELPDDGPNSAPTNRTIYPSIAEEDPLNSSKDPLYFASRDSAVGPGGDLINILSDKQKYTSMWQLIHQQLVSSEASTNEAQDIIQADEKESGDGHTCHEMSNLNLELSKNSNNLKEDVDDQVAKTEKLGLQQTAAIKLVQEALNAILQHDAESFHQQPNPVQEMANSFVRERISTPTTSIEENCSKGGEIDGKVTGKGSAEKQQQTGKRSLQKEPDEQKSSGKQMSKSFSKLRKLFVTAKFIKAMERLKKINPRKPQYLSAEPTSENESIYLRHLSMNERKNTEEWMLDNALRQVISRLDPDQQRRVTQLVEAFEIFTPEQKEKSNRAVTHVSAPGSKLAIPMMVEKKQFLEPVQDTLSSNEQFLQKKDDGALVSQKAANEENCSREENEYQTNTTGDKILLESDETSISDSTSVFSEKSSTFVDGNTGNGEPINTLSFTSQFPTEDSEVSLTGDMTSIFFNKQQYTGMWNLIYQHVSNEASVDEKQGTIGFNEENLGDTINCQQKNDKDSIPGSYNMDQKEDHDNQKEASENSELDQSAAIKLVKEALSAILKRYDQPPHLQSIPDHQKAADDARDLYISTPTPATEENSIEGGKSAELEKHAYIDLEEKLHHVKNTSLPVQQQVESDELKTPQRKMSNSLSKLKKAIATTRFIKAMERLTKSSPRKSQNLHSETTSGEERVYLRHRSMDGKKKGEEWMLDYALKQVISKLDPDQQRRVALLVEAFETVHPEQREKRISCYPSKDSVLATSTNEVKECYLESQQKRSISVEQVPQKQDNGIPLPSGDAFLERSLQEHHNQPRSLADDIIPQQTNEIAISKSTPESSEDSSRIVSKVGTPEKLSIQDEGTGTNFEFPSPFPTGNSEVRPDGNMATILSDKRKYTSMWNLIHQHVLSNEATTAGKQEVKDEEQGDDTNTFQTINDSDSTQSTELKKSKVDEDNQNGVFDQSAAINLVKEAIDAILKCHKQKSDQRPSQDHGRGADSAKILCNTTALASTQENSEGERVEKQRNSEPEQKIKEVEKASDPLQQKAEPNEANKGHTKMSKSLSKLKKAIVTTKFIKAMERLRKISPRKPRYLSPEVASEEERVYLRHLSINERKNDEEWMLDYALRKVLSNLAPDQQRKVALLVEAFETVPEQKNIGYLTKPDTISENAADEKGIPESKHDSSTSYDDDIRPMHNDRLDMLGNGSTLDKSAQEDHSIKFSNLREQLSPKILDSDDSNLNIRHQPSSKGSPNSDPLCILTVRKEETDVNPIHETFQHANEFEQENKANKAEGIFCDKRKNSGMWHLIYQHAKSVGAAEAGSKLSERLTREDQVNRGGESFETNADVDADDSDGSSVTSELTENDAIKLVREAITDILDAPLEVEDELTSSYRTADSEEGEREFVEGNPKRSLFRGYSKLRKIIICNKFIKAMEKTQKFNPQTGRALNSDSVATNAQLKTCALGERKGMDEWMLDNVLQKVISGLAPVQQKRVSLLVEAFERVNPDPEGREKGLCYFKTEFPDTISSEGDTKEKEDTVSTDSSQNSKFPCGFDLKLDRSPISSPKVVTERVLQEFHEDRSPGLTKEYVSDGQSWRSGDPCNITAATSDAIRIPSDTCKDVTEMYGKDAPGVSLEERTKSRNEIGAQVEEITSIGELKVGNTVLASKLAKKLPQPVESQDEWNYSVQHSRFSEKSTGLWGLILQHVSTDMLEKSEAPETVEINANAEGGSSSTKVSERKTDDSSQLCSSQEEITNFRDEIGAQVEEITSIGELEVGNTLFASKLAKKPPRPIESEDEGNYSAKSSRSSEISTGLWGLILQHVSTDMLEKNEVPETTEINANAEGGSSSTKVAERKTDDSSEPSSRVKSCRDMGVQTPTSFEFEENEAIKLVEEAVEEILLLQDQICDAESMTSSTTSEQGVYSQNNGDVKERSPVDTEIASASTSLHSVATLEEEKTSSRENLPNSYSTLSKVVLCKRFVKAMNKMRKLKAQQAQDLSQSPHSQEGNPSLRQISTSKKASWEEGMLDNALQKVIGNLAPAKKQRVALLVQAFETVGSQPEPVNSWRGKKLVS
ncbi:calmodulin binding protein PICBP isoform X1 [Spinacia oleracea]|uniref:Calmodulin binding protein PICBP isoform X1 n=1 Tax=Spinacia oleracea TaxID=3562 RepID=A0A9R0KBR9_SPIOL|nr:calmodulin binding protein PICBP isoform X1 [Spinacia oleracea]